MGMLEDKTLVIAHLQSALKALSEIEKHDFQSVLDVAKIIETKNGKVFVSGIGTSGTTARRMAHLLSVTGTPAIYLHPADGLHGSVAAIEKNDVLIALSKGGKSAELIKFTQLAKDYGASIIVLTESSNSPLAKLADVVVSLPEVAHPADPASMIAMTSTLASSLWGDCLSLLLMSHSGYGWDQILKSHPAGAVGEAGLTESAKWEKNK